MILPHQVLPVLKSARPHSLSYAFGPTESALLERIASNDRLAAPRLLYFLGLLFVGALVLRPVAWLNLSDIFFLIALVLTGAVLLATRQRVGRALPGLLLVGLTLFVLGGALSSAGAERPLVSALVVARVVFVAGALLWVSAQLLTHERHLRTAVGAWVAGASLASLAGLFQLTLGDVIPGAGYSGGGRVAGLTTHVNALGALTCVSLVPAFWCASQPRDARARRFGYVAVALIATGLVLSKSVGGILAAIVAAAIWLVATRQLRPVLVAGASGVLLVALATVALPNYSSPSDRLTQVIAQGENPAPPGTRRSPPAARSSPSGGPARDSRPGASASRREGGAPPPTAAPRRDAVRAPVAGSDGAAGTFWTRFDTYIAAGRAIAANPLIGAGLSPDGTKTATGWPVHNLLLRPGFEGGILALLGMVLIYAAVGLTAWRNVVEARSLEERALAVALLAAVTAFLINGLKSTTLFERLVWVSAALVFGLRAYQTTRERDDPEAATSADGEQSPRVQPA